MRTLCLCAVLTAALSVSLQADRATLIGKVTDFAGKPLSDATGMIYHAGVKKGYSTFCPSCYSDCGKRTSSNAAGEYTIKGLDPHLWCELLVVREGYAPVFVDKVDPSRGPAKTAVLSLRAPVDDASRVVRGGVVDVYGQPLRAAVVTPDAVAVELEDGPTILRGTIEGVEPVAVTNANGDLSLHLTRKPRACCCKLRPRHGNPVHCRAYRTGAPHYHGL